jgi:hypothetical protein
MDRAVGARRLADHERRVTFIGGCETYRANFLPGGFPVVVRGHHRSSGVHDLQNKDQPAHHLHPRQLKTNLCRESNFFRHDSVNDETPNHHILTGLDVRVEILARTAGGITLVEPTVYTIGCE